jgi:hypothetical protein
MMKHQNIGDNHNARYSTGITSGCLKAPHPCELTPARLVSSIVWLDCACQGCPN